MEETNPLPFPIKEELFVSKAMIRRVKQQLGSMPVAKALKIANRHRWIDDSSKVVISAVCPDCGWHTEFEKNGDYYEGRCNNCLQRVSSDFDTADSFLEYVYGKFYEKAKTRNKLTAVGKVNPCTVCNGNKIEVIQEGDGKWNVRCTTCNRSLSYNAPTKNSAIAVWNQLCLDSFKIKACPTCRTNKNIFTERAMRYSFRCKCERCGTIGPMGTSKSDAWRMWNLQVDLSECPEEGVLTGDNHLWYNTATRNIMENIESLQKRLDTLEEENKFLKGMLIKFIGVSFLMKNAGSALAASLEPIHKASLSVVESLKSLPSDEWKNAPKSLVDFLNNAFDNKGAV